MAEKGMGIVYEQTSRGARLRTSPTPAEREALLSGYHRPHHARWARAVQSILDEHGRCLLIDAHSFASAPLPHEPDQTPRKPGICIGTDRFHTPEAVANRARERFSEQGFSVDRDRPFGGSLVPKPYYLVDARVTSIMVELRRNLYMDESTGKKLPNFETFLMMIRTATQELIRTWTS